MLSLILYHLFFSFIFFCLIAMNSPMHTSDISPRDLRCRRALNTTPNSSVSPSSLLTDRSRKSRLPISPVSGSLLRSSSPSPLSSDVDNRGDSRHLDVRSPIRHTNIIYSQEEEDEDISLSETDEGSYFDPQILESYSSYPKSNFPMISPSIINIVMLFLFVTLTGYILLSGTFCFCALF